MKRKGYAFVTITLEREIDVELDDSIKSTPSRDYELVKKTIEKKFGKLQNNDSFEICEIDYAD